jgi:biopolymer transport protein ExbD
MLLSLPASNRKKISLTPLIDVVFILLLFFMLSSQFTQWQQLTLSSPSTAKNQADEYTVIRLNTNDGLVEINHREYRFDGMAAIQAYLQENTTDQVVVVTKPSIVTQTVVTLIDDLKSAGISHVSMAGVIE